MELVLLNSTLVIHLTMAPSIYINLEDDVTQIVERIKKEKSAEVVLVCPKRCFLFNDSINLRLLKKQADILKKDVSILTMDERGQLYAKEAGFSLKFLPKKQTSRGISDIGHARAIAQVVIPPAYSEPVRNENLFSHTVNEIKNIPKLFSDSKHHNSSKEAHPLLSHSSSLKTALRANTRPPAVPKVFTQEAVFTNQEVLEQTQVKRRNHNQRAITGLVAISLALILALVFVVLPKATVVVYPKTEPVTRDLELSMSTAIKEADASRLVIPATQIDETIEVSQIFQSQGKKEIGNKASGSVTIYNFTNQPLNLKANTTTLTVGSKSYLLVSDVLGLRPTGYKDARTKEVDSSTLGAPVGVVAQDGGESFNVPAGTRVEITNQVFGSKPQFLYAKTSSAITGGTTRYLSVISDQDIASSQSVLADQLLQQLRTKLKTRNLGLPEKTYTIEQITFVTDKPAATESPSFEADLKARVVGLALNQEQLKKLVFDRISQTLSSNKTLVANNPEKPLDESVKSVDLNTQQAVLAIHFEGKAVLGLNLDNVAAELTGKTQVQVNEILRSKAEVARIDMFLAPSWQKRFPFFAQKIHISQGEPEDITQ